MKKLLLVHVALAVLIAPAMAAEKPVPVFAPAHPMVVALPVYGWTGFYVGGNVGYGWSHRDFSNTITGTLGNLQDGRWWRRVGFPAELDGAGGVPSFAI